MCEWKVVYSISTTLRFHVFIYFKIFKLQIWLDPNPHTADLVSHTSDRSWTELGLDEINLKCGRFRFTPTSTKSAPLPYPCSISCHFVIQSRFFYLIRIFNLKVQISQEINIEFTIKMEKVKKKHIKKTLRTCLCNYVRYSKKRKQKRCFGFLAKMSTYLVQIFFTDESGIFCLLFSLTR